MADPVAALLPSLRETTASVPGYFEFDPAAHSDNALIHTAMDSSHVLRLDAFHKRPAAVYDLPENAHIYAARPLPPLPLPALKSQAIESLRRPSLTSSHRTVTTDCIDRSMLPQPLRTSLQHRRGQSVESLASKVSDISDISTARPRTARGNSFRNFLSRATPAQEATIPEAPRTSSSLSSCSESSHYSRHDSIVDEPVSKTTTPASSAPGSRRPSTLSLASLRARKVSQDQVPSVPRPLSRKESSGASNSRRWNPFSIEKTQTISLEDGEHSPTGPNTPTAELSCKRCYYYSMRNCNGWVMGGTHGDACENCTMHGFFGSP